jgi:hypothetical protein
MEVLMGFHHVALRVSDIARATELIDVSPDDLFAQLIEREPEMAP